MVDHAKTPTDCFFCGHPLNAAPAATLVCPACGMAEFASGGKQPQQQPQPQPKKDELAVAFGIFQERKKLGLNTYFRPLPLSGDPFGGSTPP